MTHALSSDIRNVATTLRSTYYRQGSEFSSSSLFVLPFGSPGRNGNQTSQIRCDSRIAQSMRWRRFMKIRVRVLLSLPVASMVLVLASCGHYTCGSTFGSSTCSTSGGGITSGGGNGSGEAVAFLLADGVNNGPVGMASDKLDLSKNTWVDLGSAFTPPPLPQTGVTDGGTVVVNLSSAKYLYIPFSNSTVYGYAIDGATGALTQVPGSPVIATAGSPSIAADPAGRFLFVGDFTSGDITVFTINQTNGSLTVVQGSPFASGIGILEMSTDGQGKFLYAVDGGQVLAFAINQTSGALSGGASFVSPMGQVEGEKTGKYLLGVVGGNADSHIHVFGINSQTGAIAEVTGSPFATVTPPSNIVVHPTGAFVYSFSSSGFAVEGYQISANTGALTAVAGSPFSSVKLDTGEFDQSGKFLFGLGSGNLGFPSFAPYPTDPTTGVMSATTFQTLGFPGGGFAVSDLTNAP
jgi:6-phosphogluconolactonase (cycloisomerase 2 family)